MALTDEQLKALGLDMPPPDVAMAPAPPPAAILPPSAPPQFPRSIMGDKIPQGAAIPASHEQGKEEFNQYMPRITSDPGTTDYFRQRQEQLDYKSQHPWGDPISAHPGVLGKIAHGLATAGNIAGDILAPDTMALIPGTQLHKAAQTENNEAGIQAGERGAQEEATTAATKEATAEAPAKLKLEQEKAENTADKNTNELARKYRQLGLKQDAQGNFAPVPYEEMSPTEQAAHDLKTNQAEAADARAELDKAKANPNSQIYQMQLKRLQIAEQNSKNAAQRLGLSEQQFANKTKEQELLKPTGQAQSRGSAAQSVLDLIPDLKTLVEKHREDMGPLMGRINRGEIAIGNVDPEIAKLYSAMKSFYALQPAVHGFRNAEFVKDFEHALGTLERDPDAFIAGMEGLKPTLEAVNKEGKTFHKRIVEGEGGGSGKGADFSVKAGTKTYSFKDQASLDAFKKAAGIQ